MLHNRVFPETGYTPSILHSSQASKIFYFFLFLQNGIFFNFNFQKHA